MKKKSKQQPQQAAPAPLEPITRRGKKVITMGVGILLLGFIVLSRTDAMGRNWASLLSPFLILGGYAVIGIGIFLPEKLPTFVPDSTPPQP